MELISGGVGFTQFIHSELVDEPFTLIDVGCAGGIDQAWRAFGPQLRALAIDPNISECEQLSQKETNPNVNYICGFADWEKESEFAKSQKGRNYVEKNPWSRLAVAKTVEMRSAKPRTTQELTRENQWQCVDLSPKHYRLSQLFDDQRLDDIDFIKIDIDGPDFLVLESIKNDLMSRRVLGVGMEVNFYGSTHPTEHTFHNTDRFMRSQGFELFGLTQRLYSLSALPQRYELSIPAQSIKGRPFQGDAIYLRDFGDPEAKLLFPLTRAKLLKLAALFDLFDKTDHTAEILKTHQNVIGNADLILDWLAERMEIKVAGGYQSYINAFLSDSKQFYPQTDFIKQTILKQAIALITKK